MLGICEPKSLSAHRMRQSPRNAEEGLSLIHISHELQDYLDNGNITNSVNLPNVSMERSGDARICVIHRNIPNILAQITSIVSGAGMNVENLANKSRKDYAYTMLDVNGKVSDAMVEKISAIQGVIRIRVMQN